MQRPLPTIGLFVEGTFLPSREGATKRFLGVARNLTKLGHKVVVIHCYRGWSDLAQISAEPFITYAVAPDVYYCDIRRISLMLHQEQVEVMQFAEIETIYRIGVPLKAVLPEIVLAYECHDVHSLFLQSIGASKEKIERVTRIEQLVLPCCDLIVCFTDEDKEALRVRGGTNQRAFVMPLGLDIPNILFHGPCLHEKNLLFLGNLFHWPNRRAFEHIITSILPEMRLMHPPCRVTIVGDYPKELKHYKNVEGLHLLGMVDNLEEPLSQATLGLAPITNGSGIKVKVLDYFGAGLPTVGTEMAFRGFPPSAGAVVSDIESMPGVIETLLNDSALLMRLGQSNRRLAEEFDWQKIREMLSALYVEASASDPSELNSICAQHKIDDQFALPYFLEDNLSQGRFDPTPYPQMPKGATLRLGPSTAQRD